jgi:hypothetical protein
MTRLVEQLTTRLPVEAAFAYVADFSRQAEWDPNTRSSRRVDDGPLGIGARFALEVSVGGRSAPMEYRITEYDPPRRVVLVGEGSGVWSSDEISFTAVPDGTRVDYVAEIKLRGILGLAQPLMGGALAKIGRGAAEGMRAALEAQAPR